MVNQVRELLAIAGTSARIDVHDNVSLGSPDLLDGVEAIAIICKWPAMNFKNQRILLARVKIRRLHNPAFDLAFCLNHLLLKGARNGATRAPYLAAFRTLADAYLAGVDWDPTAALDMRAASLLPALFLARVDGKSPVEYLTSDIERQRVRAFAAPMIATPPRRVHDARLYPEY